MLKGHVFSKQLFENPIFALFINTFLNGTNGVSDNYGDGMEITYSGSNITIGSGAVCIQGRFLEEDTSTTLNAGTDTMFCKLVLEINLDEENTTTEFNQGAYKIIKNASNYPSVVQSDIVKNNAGIYQYELAQFKTGALGITDFVDKRTFLDFKSIYKEIEKHIQDIDNGTIYQTKNSYSIIYGKTNPVSDDSDQCQSIINYPEGFNKNNCVVISIMFQGISNLKSWCTGSSFDSSNTLSGSVPSTVKLRNDDIQIIFKNILLATNDITIPQTKEFPTGAKLDYRLVLMKLPELIEGVDYILGDVNGDGNVNEEDYQLIPQFMNSNLSFTQKQFKAADMNRDEQITPLDYVKLKNYVEGKEPLN